MYFWLIALLIVGSAILSLWIFLKRRRAVATQRSEATNLPEKGFRRAKAVRRASTEVGNTMAQKLGDRVVMWMIDITRSRSKAQVAERIGKIREECTRLNNQNLPADNKKIISSVLLWSNNFNVDLHVSEMTLYNRSTQIVYNLKKHDFQLTIKQT